MPRGHDEKKGAPYQLLTIPGPGRPWSDADPEVVSSVSLPASGRYWQKGAQEANPGVADAINELTVIINDTRPQNPDIQD
jgi:hypothetical protein